MIINEDIHPDKHFYVVGAYIIEVLQSDQASSIDSIKLHEKLSNQIDIPIQSFFLSLTWLFMLGVVDQNDEGQIIKCF